MVAFFAGAAVAALATSQGGVQTFDYVANNTDGFFRAPDTEFGDHNFGDHIEQRIKFTVPSLKNLIKERGLFSKNCKSGQTTTPHPGQGGITTDTPCIFVHAVADQKFTRPPVLFKQKRAHLTGDQVIGKWSYVHNGNEVNVCLQFSFGAFDSNDPNNRNRVGHGISNNIFTTGPVIPQNYPRTPNLEEIRNSDIGYSDFPAIFGRDMDPIVMTGAFYSHEQLAPATFAKLRILPAINLAFYPCGYDGQGFATAIVETDATGNAQLFDADTNAANKAAFIEAIPDELGLEYILAAITQTPEQLMDVDPMGSGEPPSVFDIVSLSIGSVALAIGLGFLVSKISRGSVLTGSPMDYFAL
jgi:hypothetical protein